MYSDITIYDGATEKWLEHNPSETTIFDEAFASERQAARMSEMADKGEL